MIYHKRCFILFKMIAVFLDHSNKKKYNSKGNVSIESKQASKARIQIW